ETARAAREEPEASTMHFYRTIGEALRKRDGAGFQTTEARAVKAERLSDITYDEVLREQAIFGTPEAVVDRWLALREEVGFTILPRDDHARIAPPILRLASPFGGIEHDLVAVDVHPDHRHLGLAAGAERDDVAVRLVLEDLLHRVRQLDRHDRALPLTLLVHHA